MTNSKQIIILIIGLILLVGIATPSLAINNTINNSQNNSSLNKTSDLKIDALTNNIKKDIEKTIQSRETAKISVKERLELLRKQKELMNEREQNNKTEINKTEYITKSKERIKLLFEVAPYSGNKSELIISNLKELNKSIANAPEIINKKENFFERLFSSKHVLNKDLTTYFAKNSALMDNIKTLTNETDCDISIKKFIQGEIDELSKTQEQYMIVLHQHKRNRARGLIYWLKSHL